MTPPRRRRPQPSTTPGAYSTRSLVPGPIPVPRTRSMARSATKKLQVYDENADSPASAARSLRSRGPLRENPVNVLEERKMDINGKRKASDGEEKSAKMIKLDHRQPTNLESRTKESRPIRTAKYQSSTESLRSLRPSIPSTPIARQPIAQPTPARELLRRHDDTTSPSTSPPRHLVARPPTPPRMRERHAQVPVTATPNHAPPATPLRAHSSADEGLPTGMRVSKMPASLRKPPGQSLMPPASSKPPFTPRSAMPGSLRHTPQRADLALPTTTPTIAPSPRKVFAGVSRSPQKGTTTPLGPPPSLPDCLSAPAGTSTRLPQTPSFTSRLAAASKSTETQPTLHRFLQRPTVPPRQVHSEAQPPSGGKLGHEPPPTRGQPQAVEVEDDVVEEVEPRSMGIAGKEELKSSSENALVVSVDEGSGSTSTSLSLNNNATRSIASMAPPIRIPRSSALPTIASAAKASEKVQAVSTIAKKPSIGLGQGSLPERRPSGRPAMLPTSAQTSVSNSAPIAPPSPVKRKPSYPSSLGSGPLARPRPRLVSNPVLPPRSISDSSPSPSATDESPVVPQSRSVSAPAPAPAPRPRLSNGTSTREGLSGETSKSLAGLSEALGKLKTKRPEQSASNPAARQSTAPSISVTAPHQVELDERPSNLMSSTAGAPSRLTLANHVPRASVHPGDLSTSSDEGTGPADQSIAALLCSTNGGGCLRGVRAFVDVKTSDGEDSGKLFVEILRGLGAKVFTRPTESCTHIIYKSGKPSTLSWWRKQEDPKPFIVGIKWVTDCKKGGKRVDEASFEVNVEEEDIFQKKRKSMEPKSLATAQGLTVPVNPMRQALLDVAQARRNSMKYAPKISSPLKKGYMQPHDE